MNAPPEEQEICIRCGLCCDGTLFLHARLDNGELGNLPEKIEVNSYEKDGIEFFRLPYLYFDGKCTIYDLKKANVCSGYRCQLLINFANGKLSLNDALAVVSEAICMRDEIADQYMLLTGTQHKIYFKKLLREMGKIRERDLIRESAGSLYDLLLARCNIFEALLIRNFSPAGDFEKMVMK